MNLLQTIKIEIERKTAESVFLTVFFAFFFLVIRDKGGIIVLTFFLAYTVFPEEIVKGKVTYLLKLPYKKFNLITADYIFGVILGLVPMLIVMLFFGFDLQKIVYFFVFYTAFFSVQTMISLFMPRASLIFLGSFLIFTLDSSLSSFNSFYHEFSIASSTYFSLFYAAVLLMFSYFIFKKHYKG